MESRANTLLLLAMFVVSAVLFGLILNAVGVPGGFVIGVVLAVPFCALLVSRNRRKFAERWGKQTVTFSPAGAVMADPDTTTTLTWANVDAIGDVQLMPAVQVLGRRNASLTVKAIDAAQGTREHGLVGAGVLAVNPEVEVLRRQQVHQFLNSGAPDARIGQRPMGIPLARFDLHWPDGRIGQWVHAYRPDLVPTPRTTPGP